MQDIINKSDAISEPNNPNDKLSFVFFPEFARFILNDHLDSFVIDLLRNSREENVPILKFFEHFTEEELISLSKNSNTELLTLISENRTREYILKSNSEYLKNQIPHLERAQILAEDITSISLVRRKTFRKYLMLFTKEFEVFANVMEEIDRFIAESESNAYTSYLNIQNEKLNATNRILAQREHDLLEAQELNSMGSFFWDLSGKNSFYTPGVAKILELENESDMNTFLEFVHVDDRQMLKDSVENSLIGNGFFECEYRYVKNHIEKIIWSRGHVTFENNIPVSMRGTLMDISQKSRILKRLEESEKLHTQSQALTHIGNWSWKIGENKIEWSDEMFRIYGLEPQSEDITFERFISLVHPDDREKRITEIQEALSSLKVSDYMMRVVNPDGAVKILRGRGQVITDKNLNPIRLIGTCQDITPEYNLTEAIKEKEDYLNQIINNAPDSVIVINEEGNITLWNPKTEEIFGWTSEEVIGKPLSDTIIPFQYREAHKKGMARFLETGQAHILNKTLELSAINKSGKEFFISLTISRSIQNNQNIFIAFIRDITKEKLTKEELNLKTSQLIKLNKTLGHKNIELERINRELESFNYIASHDLQEPLRKIQIFTNRIIETESQNFSPRLNEYLGKIISSSVRMKTLIEDLLTFSQAGESLDNLEVTDLNYILDEARNTLSNKIEEKNVTISSALLPSIRVVPFQFQQLFYNLLSNAIKYSHDSIPVFITIKWKIISGEEVPMKDVNRDRNYFQISFEDNGIGFEDIHSEKIFGLFQRLHGNDKYSGTGIGLAICKKIIQNHQGFITATSKVGHGSCFTIFLPNENSLSKVSETVN